jgi:dCTP deaminase
MVLSAQSILRLCNPPDFLKIEPMITPFFERKMLFNGMSYGLSACGYDIRLRQRHMLYVDAFVLGSSMEQFTMPLDVMGEVKDKSSMARMGISVFNTVIEPGWKGYLTLEIKNQGAHPIELMEGQPIAQIIFYRLDHPTIMPYKGKYQNQGDQPTEAIHEAGSF